MLKKRPESQTNGGGSSYLYNEVPLTIKRGIILNGPAQTAPGSGPPDADRETAVIHIVDDEEDVRTALELQLRKSGHAIRSFSDGASFLAAAAQDPPDVVLLDILMPGLDGLETLYLDEWD